MTDLEREVARFQLSLWCDVLVSSLSGAAVVGTLGTKHLVGAAAEIADEAVRRVVQRMNEDEADE